MEYFRIVRMSAKSNCLEFVKFNPLIKAYNRIRSNIRYTCFNVIYFKTFIIKIKNIIRNAFIVGLSVDAFFGILK